MSIDFKNISYLKTGNARQQAAYEVLSINEILPLLKAYSPILVGTIPINIDIENSDLDIICYAPDPASFKDFVINTFGHHDDFKIWENDKLSTPAVVAGFMADGFKIELFGQNIPTTRQNAYRHMLIEHRLLTQKGASFRKKIIELKRQGLKTEPAFAQLLGLKGDPYKALLDLEI